MRHRDMMFNFEDKVIARLMKGHDIIFMWSNVRNGSGKRTRYSDVLRAGGYKDRIPVKATVSPPSKATVRSTQPSVQWVPV